MSTKAQIKTPANAPAAPAAAHITRPPVAVPEHEAEQLDMAPQLEGAARLGHSFGALGVDGAAMPLIQRQEIPEEDEEEEELQMKREPAALQRQEQPEEEEELMLKPDVQRVGAEGGPVSPEVEAAIQRARGGGQPLDGAVQAQMSEALGHDFSGVRVHTGAEADALNRQLSAKAFTTGPDLFFRRGEYNPGSGSGRELIAHELSHVVQQSTGRVSGGECGMTVRPAEDPKEQAADDLARRVSLSTSYGNRASREGISQEHGGRHAGEGHHSLRDTGPRRLSLSRRRVTGAVHREGIGVEPVTEGFRMLLPIGRAVSGLKRLGVEGVIQRQLVYADQPGNVEVPVGSLLFGQAGSPGSVKKIGKHGVLPAQQPGGLVKVTMFTHAAIYKGKGLIWEFWPHKIKERPIGTVKLKDYVAMSPPSGLQTWRLLEAMGMIKQANEAGEIKYTKKEAKGEWRPFYNEPLLKPSVSYCVDIVARAYQFALRIMPVAGGGPQRQIKGKQELGRHMSVQELYAWADGAGFGAPRTVTAAELEPEPVTPSGAVPRTGVRLPSEEAVVEGM